MKYNINGKDEKTLTILMAALGHHTKGFQIPIFSINFQAFSIIFSAVVP